jgi:hypothetical protein
LSIEKSAKIKKILAKLTPERKWEKLKNEKLMENFVKQKLVSFDY